MTTRFFMTFDGFRSRRGGHRGLSRFIAADQKGSRQRPRRGDDSGLAIPSAAQFGVDVVNRAVVVVVAEAREFAAHAVRERLRRAADDEAAARAEQLPEVAA